ncbi:hypothetical protein B0A48_17669 [Cryoendolithus antarcticus]|uniref:Uncharacterized protein n=1 Tax=Cryoendolithus antarcticus TaxID=1507870 RepID=A0A1V8SBN7_9PEZI|nr:hypothetical protein B0A48_17669 [Cryoendolithus antarcticus]
MWLLNATTFELHYFQALSQAPQYAVLSHTWRDEEVIFQDIRDPESARTKQGWRKIQYTCEQTRKDDLEYCWVDTCCINKESSAELSESINSMYGIYGGAAICYIYLDDITENLQLTDLMDSDLVFLNIMRARKARSQVELASASDTALTTQVRAFANARWWTRCFTLQELIAPPDAHFYNQTWEPIARRHDIVSLVSSRTGIDLSVLQRTADPLDMSIAKRLSWAASRQATREEDVAYSLLGLLDVDLPLLYGEGSRAFTRLQEELLRTKSDLSTLAWRLSIPQDTSEWRFSLVLNKSGLFATSPDDFRGCGFVTASDRRDQTHRLVLTSTVMDIELPVISASMVNRIEKLGLDQRVAAENPLIHYVGGLTLTEENAGQVQLVFVMLRDLHWTHGGGRDDVPADENWASFVPNTPLNAACKSLAAEGTANATALAKWVESFGHLDTLDHDFDKYAVQVAIESGQSRSLDINITISPLAKPDNGQPTYSANGREVPTHNPSITDASGSNDQPSLTGGETKKSHRHWRMSLRHS